MAMGTGKETISFQSEPYSAYHDKTFLRDFEPLIRPDSDTFKNTRESQALGRYVRQLELVQTHLPRAWFIGNFLLTGLLPEELSDKINSPKNLPHALQHINRVAQDARVATVYTPEVVDRPETDKFDFCLSLEISVIGHDLLQIDNGKKLGHDHLGSIFVPGLMQLARLNGFGEINQRQMALVAEAVYHHSHPERKEPRPSIQEILDLYRQDFEIDPEAAYPSFKWLVNALQEHGCDLYSLDLTLVKKDQRLAELVTGRLVAADKRDSNAPPFMANLRTIMTKPNRPYADFSNGIKPHRYLIDAAIAGERVTEADFFDDLSRIFYELARDPIGVGMLAFETSWLTQALARREEYAVGAFADGLVSGNLDFLKAKYTEWINVLAKEAVVEDRVKQTGPTTNLFNVFGLKISHIDDLTRKLTKAIYAEYYHAFQVLQRKSFLQRQMMDEDLPVFAKNLEQLSRYLEKQRPDFRRPRHHQVPELPVFVATYGIS
ncbi:MAG: hypothetical protein U1C50_04390 [Patescibacteria group bacterium]|nr:hypothetical protein [Patescibacteria group bacterium]